MQDVPVLGFQSQRIEVDIKNNGFSAPKLFLNGLPAPPAPKRGEFLLHDDNGREVVARFKNNFPDTVPQLIIGDQTVRLAEPLAWYQWIWAGAPLILILLGGAIGGAIGALGLTLNTQIMRSDQNPFLRYFLSGLVTVGVFVGWFIIAALLQSALPSSRP